MAQALIDLINLEASKANDPKAEKARLIQERFAWTPYADESESEDFSDSDSEDLSEEKIDTENQVENDLELSDSDDSDTSLEENTEPVFQNPILDDLQLSDSDTSLDESILELEGKWLENQITNEKQALEQDKVVLQDLGHEIKPLGNADNEQSPKNFDPKSRYPREFHELFAKVLSSVETSVENLKSTKALKKAGKLPHPLYSPLPLDRPETLIKNLPTTRVSKKSGELPSLVFPSLPFDKPLSPIKTPTKTKSVPKRSLPQEKEKSISSFEKPVSPIKIPTNTSHGSMKARGTKDIVHAKPSYSSQPSKRKMGTDAVMEPKNKRIKVHEKPKAKCHAPVIDAKKTVAIFCPSPLEKPPCHNKAPATTSYGSQDALSKPSHPSKRLTAKPREKAKAPAAKDVQIIRPEVKTFDIDKIRTNKPSNRAKSLQVAKRKVEKDTINGIKSFDVSALREMAKKRQAMGLAQRIKK